MTKKELRAAMKKRNLSLSSEERDAASERIFGRVERLPGFSAARCAAFFCALPDFIVVPGVAFTAAAARMGRGRGYYDKYLSQPGFRGVKAGVCYAHQLVGELPVEPHDVFMDYVVTND